MKNLIKVSGCLMVMVLLTSVYACSSQSNRTVKANTNSEMAQSKPETPAMEIHTAAFMGNLKAIQQHIAAGTNLNEKDQYGSTPLTIAITFGKTDIANTLIAAGADLTVTGNDGSTPLHTAAFLCRTDIVKALLNKGASKSAKNNYGSTALETISGPFAEVKPIYEQLNKDLGPLGLKLDLKYIEATRPIVAELLQ